MGNVLFTPWILLNAAVLLLPGSARTPASGLLLEESFDGVVPPSLPPGWTSSRNKSAEADDIVTATGTSHSAPIALLSTNATVAQWVMSPSLDLSGCVPDSLIFFSRRSSTHGARVVVEVTADGGSSFPFPVGDTLRPSGSGVYIRSAFSLPAVLAGRAGVRIRWRIIPDSVGSTGTLRFDDVCISVRLNADLSLAELMLAPAGQGEENAFLVSAVVLNRGMQPASGFDVAVYLDADRDSVPCAAELITVMPFSGQLPPGDSVLVSATAGRLPAGAVGLIAEVRYPSDQDMRNNRGYLDWQVGCGRGAMAINEIMYQPRTDEPEWIELTNTRSDSISMTGWSLSDAAFSQRRNLTGLPVKTPGGGYVILTGDSGALVQRYPGLNAAVISVTSFPSLNNTGDAVVLYDESGTVIDSVWYSPWWGGSEGKSLERLDPMTTANEPSNWSTCAESPGATPGRQNSVAILDTDLTISSVASLRILPGEEASVPVAVRNVGRTVVDDFVVSLYRFDAAGPAGGGPDLVGRSEETTILRPRDSLALRVRWNNPPPGLHGLKAVVSARNDQRRRNDTATVTMRIGASPGTLVVNEIMFAPLQGSSEYVEVMNAGLVTVDVNQWSISTTGSGADSASRHFLAYSKAPLGPGEFAVVGGDSSLLSLFPSLRDPAQGTVALGRTASLGLNNEGDQVFLLDGAGIVVDSVAYLPGWHNPDVHDCDGRSLERMVPTGPSSDRRNWGTCTLPVGGTPGRTNSIFIRKLAAQFRLSCSPNPFSPDGDGIEDFTLIHYDVPLQSSIVSIKIFDIRGRLVRRLAYDVPGGPQGDIPWDGRDDDRRRGRIGIYIVLMEAIDSAGGIIQSAKTAVILAGNL